MKSILDYKRGQKYKYKIYKGLTERGFTKEEAAVIMGNLRQESAFDPQAELRGVNPKSKIREDSYGLMQWRKGRLDNLKKLAKKKGRNISDLDVQLDYIKEELKGKGYEAKQFKKAMKAGDTLVEKTMGFAKYVERPASSELKKGSTSYNNRTKAALEFNNLDDTTIDGLILKSSGAIDDSYKPFPVEFLEGSEDEPTKESTPVNFQDIISSYKNKAIIQEEKINDNEIEQEVQRLDNDTKKEAGAVSFKDAFSSARFAGEKEFTWKGRRFHTRKKGEKEVSTASSMLGKIKAMSAIDPKSNVTKNNVNAILNEDFSKIVPEITDKTPIIASTDSDDYFNQVQSTEENRAPQSINYQSIPEETTKLEEPLDIPKGLPLDRVGGFEYEDLTTIEEDIQNVTFEGMGDDLVNKFVDRNAIGFLTQATIKAAIKDNKMDVDFDIEGNDKELYTAMTKGLEAEDIAEILDASDSRGDFIKLSSLAQARVKRSKEMEKYVNEHPVFSGTNTVGNILAEGAVFMPVSTAIAAAGKATKVKSLAKLKKTQLGMQALGETVEQGVQEVIWSANDRDYEFDPILFATGVGVGVGLKATVGSPEADAQFRQFLKDESGFINIATDEGRKLVDEVSQRVTNNKAIELAQKVTKRKIKIANDIRLNLKARRDALEGRLELLKKKMKTNKDPELAKKYKSQKQKTSRSLAKLDKKIPKQMEKLLNGTHPKLNAATNPELKVTAFAKELGIDPKTVNSVDKVRKFLGLDSPKADPNFVVEGEKSYKRVVRQQLQEMQNNKRLNMNETLRYAAGSDTVKTIDNLPVLGKLKVGDKLMSLAETDGPVSRFLFNKGNLVSSENELVSSFYNWMAPDGMGRQGMSKIRAIESQQKYANIYGGELMNLYHTHGSDIYDVINGKIGRAKGLLSPDDYENTVEPILKERLLLNPDTFRSKYGDEISDLADKFYKDFNKLNKTIIERAKELGVEGVNFDATEGWFHRAWDFRKARAVDKADLEDGIFRAMQSHMRKLDIEINESDLLKHSKKFAFGIRNADITSIEGLQSDHIKLLEKLLKKADGTEAKLVKDEISRLKLLKAKADAGDLANRVQMDVTTQLRDGTQLSDLFEDNLINTQKRYAARMSARIAAAEHGIKNIDTMDDWIRDAVDLQVKRLADKGVKNPKQQVKFIEEAMRQDLMSFKNGGMVGLYDLPDDSANDFIRLVKKYNYARLMQYTGISSIAELSGTFVEAGVSTTLREIGNTLRHHINDLYVDNPDRFTGRLYDELRSITGVGMEDFSFSTKGLSKANRVFETGPLAKAEAGVDVLGRIAQAPFGGIEKVGRRVTVNSLAIKWGNHFNGSESGGILSAFFGSNGITNRVLENSGFGSISSAGKFIPNDTYKSISDNMKRFASFDDSGRLLRLNLDKWDNSVAHKFGDAIQMQANHIMVSPDATTMALWQSSTVGQILNQFRTFTINATTKVMGATVSNAAISYNRGDTTEMVKAAQKIFWGTSLGVLSVALRQGIQRAGGDEEIDLFDEGLVKAAAIGFSRSSVAGNLPTIGDSISGMFGYDPIFEKTSSVGRSKNFFNLSTTPTGQAIGGVYQSVEKGAQGDVKGAGIQLLKTSPIYRQIGAQQIFNFIDDEK